VSPQASQQQRVAPQRPAAEGHRKQQQSPQAQQPAQQ
jgi:hypothetical protein